MKQYAIKNNGVILSYITEQPTGTRAIQLKKGSWVKVEAKRKDSTGKSCSKYKYVRPMPTFPMYQNREVI